MDFKLTGITWVGNVYQKFEEVCQEVDDIVGQDAVKYLGNQVQNVGDSVKRFYSDVVQEVLPLPHLVNSVKHENDSVALNNNVDSQFKSTAAVKENKKGTEENPVNSVLKSLHDLNAINPANNQNAQTTIELDPVNQVSNEVASNSLEGEDSYTTQEEVGDDYSRETSGVINENLLVSVEQFAVKSTPQLLSSLSLNENEPLESSIFSEPFSGSYEGGYGVVAGTEKNSDVTSVQSSCTIVEENAMKSSTCEVLKVMSFGKKESLNASLFSDSFDGDDENSCGMLAEVSPVTSITNMKCQSSPKAGTSSFNNQFIYGSESSDSFSSSEVAYSTESSEKPKANVELFCSKSSFMSDSLSTKSPGRYCFELNSCKDNLVDVAGLSLDTSLVLVSSVTTPDVGVAGQIMTSQNALVSCSSSQSMGSNERETSTVNEAISLNNLSGQISSAQDRAIVSLSEIDESLVKSIEFSKEDIHLCDDVKLEESCIFVDDSELHAVSCRTQRLRSYKKRIKDAFTPKKKLEKEYQQLAIWYGDSDIDSSEGTSQTGMPFRSRRSLEPRNLQVQHFCENGWELL